MHAAQTNSLGRLYLPALALLLLIMLLLFSGMGFISVSAGQTLQVIGAKLLGWTQSGLDPMITQVVWEVRMPRIITASAVGAGLAAAGAVFQGILLNPLADPYTLGVSSGAAFGASVALLLGLDFAGVYSVCALAFAGAVAHPVSW